MDTIKIYKKEITKKFVKKDNNTLVQMLKDNKRDEVILSLTPLVLFVVEKFKNINDFNELVSVGNMGLIKAVDKFDIDKGGNIISFARSCIKWSILDYFNNEQGFIRTPQSKKVSKKTSTNYGKAFLTDDFSLYEEENEEYSEININRKEVEELLLTIPKLRYSKIATFLDYYFVPNATCKSIAGYNGYSPQNTSLIITEILNKIKDDPILKDKFRDIFFK